MTMLLTHTAVCTSCVVGTSLRRLAPLRGSVHTQRHASSSAKASRRDRDEPRPMQIDEDTDEFGDALGELHRRRKKMDAKRNRPGGDFVDFMRVTVRGGKGGSGTSAFLPTKRGLGPPSGGNGGPGGSVYLKTSPFLTSLTSVGRRLIGGQGGHGAGNLRHGRRGEDLTVEVPVGTVIREVRREGEAEKAGNEADALGLEREERHRRTRERWLVQHPNFEASDRDIREAETLLRQAGRWSRPTPSFDSEPALELDISEPITEPILLARGGVGGLGNPHFVTAGTRHPRLASRGVLPPTRTFEFELKLLADVGLVGLPNAGKSTLLRALTGRRAEVADYAFTTLHPQIGVVRVMDDGSWAAERAGPVEETEIERDVDALARELGEYQPLPRAARNRKRRERTRFSVSDNPGLLARASENVGLGHSFLRSIERSLALAYVLDGRRPDPAADMRVLRAELEAYKPGLAGRARIVALNKTDELSHDDIDAKVASLNALVSELASDDGVEPPEVLVVSAKYGTGIDRLVAVLADAVDAARPTPKPQPESKPAQTEEESVQEEEEDLISA